MSQPWTILAFPAPNYSGKAGIEYASEPMPQREMSSQSKSRIIPDGMRYNWKTASVFGQQQARRYGRYQATGWEPVPATRHPGLFTPKGYEGDIEYDGLILMEKPEELCRQTEAREFRKAREQVQAKEQQLRGGDIGSKFDTQHQSARRATKISKQYERIDIPDE